MAKKSTTKKAVKSVKKSAPKYAKKMATATSSNYKIVVKPSKPSFSDEMIGRMMATSKSY